MDAMEGTGRAVMLLLPNPTAETLQLFRRIRSTTDQISLVAVDYDENHPSKYGGVPVEGPMDVLSPDDVDQAFRRGFDWRRNFVSALTDPALRASVAASLPAVTPTIVQLFRAIRLIEKALATADCYAVAGEYPIFPYYRIIAHRVAARMGVPAVVWQRGEARLALRCGPPNLPEDLAALARTSRKIASPLQLDRATEKELADFGERFGIRPGQPNIVLPMRFRSAVGWFHDSRTGVSLRHDSYNELYMERLARSCQDRGWRLTVLSLDGEGVVPKGGTSLTDMYPDTVIELPFVEFQRRRWPKARELERIRIARFLISGAFRSAMTLDEVPVFDCLSEDLLQGIIGRHVQYATGEGVIWWPLLEALRPSAIVGARIDSISEFMRAASLLGIPSVALRFGIGHEMAIVDMYEVPGMAPSALLTWGERSADYIRANYAGVVALGTGRPRNDTFVLEAPRIDKAAVKARLGLEPDQRMILIGINCRTRFGEQVRGRGQTITSPRTLAKCITALAKMAERLGNVRIVMKPHESDDMDMLNDVIERCGLGLTSLARNPVDGFHNVEILAAADLLIAGPSSMMAEAVACGVPSVMLATPDVRLFFEQARIDGYGAIGQRADNVRQMAALAERLLVDEAFRARQLRRARHGHLQYFGGLDGKNADRTAEAICSIVEDHLRDDGAGGGVAVPAEEESPHGD